MNAEWMNTKPQTMEQVEALLSAGKTLLFQIGTWSPAKYTPKTYARPPFLAEDGHETYLVDMPERVLATDPAMQRGLDGLRSNLTIANRITTMDQVRKLVGEDGWKLAEGWVRFREIEEVREEKRALVEMREQAA